MDLHVVGGSQGTDVLAPVVLIFSNEVPERCQEGTVVTFNLNVNGSMVRLVR